MSESSELYTGVDAEELEPTAEPVHVTGNVNAVQERPALFAAYITIPVGITGPPQQVAAQDEKRYRVLIWSDAKALIGLRDEVVAGKGATLVPNTPPVELQNKQEVWVGTTGVAANVSVVVERRD